MNASRILITRMMHPCLVASLLCHSWPAAMEAADAVPPPAVAAAVSSPDTVWSGHLAALRGNDLTALFQRLPAQDQAAVRALWATGGAKGVSLVSVAGKHSFLHLLQVIATLATPGTIGGFDAKAMIRLADPAAASGNAADEPAAGAVHMTMVVNGEEVTPPVMTGPGLAGAPAWLTSWVRRVLAPGHESAQAAVIDGGLQDLARWLPQAGFGDPLRNQKAKAIAHEALAAIGVEDLRQLTAQPLDQALKRYGTALAAVKRMLLLYGIDADALLGSCTFTITGTDPAAPLMEARFQAGAGRYAFPLALVAEGSSWRIAGGSILARFMPSSTGGGPMGIPGLSMDVEEMVRRARQAAADHQPAVEAPTPRGTNEF